MKAHLALLAGLSLALVAGCGVTPAATTTAATTVKAAAVSAFADLEGRAVSLDQFAGQAVVLVFLDPAQSDSVAEVPLMLRLAGAYPDVQFVAVGEHASVAALKAFARQYEFTFPLWQDRNGAELAKRKFTATPATQFVRRDGTVARGQQGYLSMGEFHAGLALIP